MAFRETLLDETRDIIYEIKVDAPDRRGRDPWIRDAFDIAGAIVNLHMHDLEDLDDE